MKKLLVLISLVSLVLLTSCFGEKTKNPEDKPTSSVENTEKGNETPSKLSEKNINNKLHTVANAAEEASRTTSNIAELAKKLSMTTDSEEIINLVSNVENASITANEASETVVNTTDEKIANEAAQTAIKASKEAVENAKLIVQTSLKDINKIVDETKKTAMEEATKALEDANKIADEQIKNANKIVDETLKNVNKIVDETMKDVNNTLDETLKNTNDTIENTMKDVNNSLNETMKDVDNTVNEALKNINTSIEMN